MDLKKRSEADKIQEDWSQVSHSPSVAEVSNAALLAWQGYLPTVRCMRIENMDTSNIISDTMGKLASIVTDRIWIYNMSPPSQLGSILANVQCPGLRLWYMALSQADTKALVTAMTHKVETVALDNVTLDLDALVAYDGQGCCMRLGVWYDTRTRYGARLREWASQTGWVVTCDDDKSGLVIEA